MSAKTERMSNIIFSLECFRMGGGDHILMHLEHLGNPLSEPLTDAYITFFYYTYAGNFGISLLDITQHYPNHFWEENRAPVLNFRRICSTSDASNSLYVCVRISAALLQVARYFYGDHFQF